MPQLDLRGGNAVFLDALPVLWEESKYRHGNRAGDLFEIWEAAEMESWDLDCPLPAGVSGVATGSSGGLEE